MNGAEKHNQRAPLTATPFPAQLDSLVIISNQYSDQFIDSFTDSDIKSNLDSNFPNKFDVALPTLDANMLCMMQDYKVQKYSAELKTALAL